jgi:hypothetical protein
MVLHRPVEPTAVTGNLPLLRKEWVNIKEQLNFRDVMGKSIWKERLP